MGPSRVGYGKVRRDSVTVEWEMPEDTFGHRLPDREEDGAGGTLDTGQQGGAPDQALRGPGTDHRRAVHV